MDLGQLVRRVLQEPALQEGHWLEWKSKADLGQGVWQARAARFILGAANRPRPAATGPYEGDAFLLLGVEPGRVIGTNIVDPAKITQALLRYLGSVGPHYSLDYVTNDGLAVAVFTVPPPPTGNRPYLARGTFSQEREEIRDGRIYIRRSGTTAEATAAEIDEMLAERVAARVAAGPMWPMQAEPVWRDGDTLHVHKRHGDRVMIYEADVYTNLAEMAATRPPLPEPLPVEVAERVAVFDQLLDLADAEPYQTVEETWAPLRAIVVEVYEQWVGPLPFQGFKVVDMVTRLAEEGIVEPRWVDVAYPLYYWAGEQTPDTLAMNPGVAKTYVFLAKALAAALMLTPQAHRDRKHRD
jgi:hypothetical protein